MCLLHPRAVVGAVALATTTAKIVSGEAKPSDPVTKVIYRKFEKVRQTHLH